MIPYGFSHARLDFNQIISNLKTYFKSWFYRHFFHSPTHLLLPQPTEFKPPTSFHTGKRLKLARELHGYSQEELSGKNEFPKTESRNLRRWENQGIPAGHVKQVSYFFQLEPWTFWDERLTEFQFKHLVLHPDIQEKIRQELNGMKLIDGLK